MFQKVKKVAKIVRDTVVEIRLLDFEPPMTANWQACDDNIQVGDQWSKRKFK